MLPGAPVRIAPPPPLRPAGRARLAEVACLHAHKISHRELSRCLLGMMCCVLREPPCLFSVRGHPAGELPLGGVGGSFGRGARVPRESGKPSPSPSPSPRLASLQGDHPAHRLHDLQGAFSEESLNKAPKKRAKGKSGLPLPGLLRRPGQAERAECRQLQRRVARPWSRRSAHRLMWPKRS